MNIIDSFILEDAAEYSDRTEFGDRAYKANLDLAKRADKLIEYYNCISAWEGAKVQGNNVQTEAIADMAGMKAILRIAKEKEDYDYDKFFTAYATVWRRHLMRLMKRMTKTKNNKSTAV